MKSALVALRRPAVELAVRTLLTSTFLLREVETTRLLAERSLALAVEVAFLWAAAVGCAFRVVAAKAVDAGKSDIKASRIVMGAFKRILNLQGGRGNTRAPFTLSGVPAPVK